MKLHLKIDNDKQEKRTEIDRRQDFSTTKFPVFTDNGAWIRKECRKTPERRLRNISVNETHIKAAEFKKLFKDYS